MSPAHENDTLDRLLNSLEAEILAAADRDLIEHDAFDAVGDEARAVVHATLARRSVRQGGAPLRRLARPAASRELVRQLLVASPKAKEVLGRRKVETLSNSDVEAILKQFAAFGLLPRHRP
jgi:hypothetical protein